MPSKLWPVRNQLVSTFTARFAGSATTVYDGPRTRGATPKQYLQVGATPDGSPALRSVQSRSPMGNTWREEAGEVDCVAVAWTGDTSFTTIRAAAQGVVDECEAALIADRRLGGVLALGDDEAEVVALDITEAVTDKGALVEASFTVAYRTTLT